MRGTISAPVVELRPAEASAIAVAALINSGSSAPDPTRQHLWNRLAVHWLADAAVNRVRRQTRGFEMASPGSSFGGLAQAVLPRPRQNSALRNLRHAAFPSEGTVTREILFIINLRRNEA